MFKSLKSGGYFIIGDFFPHIKKDIEYFKLFGTVEYIEEDPKAGKWSYRVFLLKKI